MVIKIQKIKIFSLRFLNFSFDLTVKRERERKKNNVFINNINDFACVTLFFFFFLILELSKTKNPPVKSFFALFSFSSNTFNPLFKSGFN